MQAESYPLQDFDLVIQSFAETAGFAVLSAVLDVDPPVADGVGGGMDLPHIGGGILFDPFCQLLVLNRIGAGSKDVMEELKNIGGFQKIRSHVKGIVGALFVVMKAWTPVRGLVVLFRFQKAGDAFYLFQTFCIPGVLKLVLIAEPNRIHHVIETFDDMGGGNADPGIGEVLF